MKVPAILNTRAAMITAGILVGGAVLYFAIRKLARAPGEIADDFNRGTPYDSSNSGAVGTAVRTVANVANETSGGILADFGGWLGRSLYDWTHSDYDPNKK